MRSLTAWQKYLDLAVPEAGGLRHESARIVTKTSEPGRMKVLQAMIKSDPAYAAVG